MIALLSLGVAGIPLVSALGLASAIGVVAAVLGAITLLPAFLGLLKHRIAWASAADVPEPDAAGPGRGMWHRWSGVVRRHPVMVTVLSLAFLVPLIIPVFSLELGQEDIGATNPDTTERQAYDLITAGFGVGYNGPLQVASELDPAGDAERGVHQEVRQGDVAEEGPASRSRRRSRSSRSSWSSSRSSSRPSRLPPVSRAPS